MSNEIINRENEELTQAPSTSTAPAPSYGNINQGTVAIEATRAAAEAQD